MVLERRQNSAAVAVQHQHRLLAGRTGVHQDETSYANLGNGQSASLFSSYDQQAVNTHFLWIQQNGIVTAALQRFNPTGGEGPDPRAGTRRLDVAAVLQHGPGQGSGQLRHYRQPPRQAGVLGVVIRFGRPGSWASGARPARSASFEMAVQKCGREGRWGRPPPSPRLPPGRPSWVTCCGCDRNTHSSADGPWSSSSWRRSWARSWRRRRNRSPRWI